MPRFTFSYEQSSFIKPTSRLLGAIDRDAISTTRSVLFYCPNCGEVWGRIQAWHAPIDASGPQPTPWSALSRLCEGCGDGHLLDPSDHIDDLPPALMLHDLQCFNLQKQEPTWP